MCTKVILDELEDHKVMEKGDRKDGTVEDCPTTSSSTTTMLNANKKTRKTFRER